MLCRFTCSSLVAMVQNGVCAASCTASCTTRKLQSTNQPAQNEVSKWQGRHTRLSAIINTRFIQYEIMANSAFHATTPFFATTTIAIKCEWYQVQIHNRFNTETPSSNVNATYSTNTNPKSVQNTTKHCKSGVESDWDCLFKDHIEWEYTGFETFEWNHSSG